LLTRPYLSDDGEWWQPSPYWDAALALFDTRPITVRPAAVRPIADAASPLELAIGAMRQGPSGGEYGGLAPQLETLSGAAEVLRARLARETGKGSEGDCRVLNTALANRFGTGHHWSASRLEKYGTCPFHFWLSAALDLELREPPEPGYDAAQLGSMLHAILEQVYQRAADPSQLDKVLAVLPAVANEVFNGAPKKYGFRPTPLWTVQRAELLEALKKTITNLNGEAAGFRPIRFEQHFGDDRPLRVDGTEIRLHGFIDRIDQNEDGELRIIDYKTGSSGFARSELSEGRRLQLPLYALAAQNALRLGQVVDGFYWGILKGEKSSLRLNDFHVEVDDKEWNGPVGAMQLAQAWTGKHIRRIQAGDFPPSPTADNCPSYCPGKLTCWRYNPSERA
ncbi:MAG: PD-(D/E)XK nuclease family protein, partial [Rudaea sp.]